MKIECQTYLSVIIFKMVKSASSQEQPSVSVNPDKLQAPQVDVENCNARADDFEGLGSGFT